MDSYQSLLDKISTLQKKASALRETAKKRVIAEIRKLIEQYDVQPAELFSDTKPRVGRPPSVSAPAASSVPSTRGRPARQSKLSKPSKPSKPPKYRDPATGKTWNGHGKTPLWLAGVSDRTAFLIEAQAEAASDMAKPKGAGKAKGAVGRKPKAPKGTAKQKRAGKREMALQAEGFGDSSSGS